MSEQDTDSDANYTRVRFHAQNGDGPDARGDVTVEVQGTLDEGPPESVRQTAETELDGAVEHLRGLRSLVARHIVAEAREFGEVEDHVRAPERGDFEVEWSVADVDDWEVEQLDDDRVAVHGTTEATYQVQTSKARRNPPGKAHPAEYETRTLPVYVGIEADWSDGPGDYTIRAEGA